MKESGSSQLYTLLPALFFGSLITYYFLNDTAFALEQLPKIIYSQATKDGIDIGARASLMYKIVFFGGLISTILWYFLRRLFGDNNDGNTNCVKKLACMSFIGLITFYCHIAHSKCLETLGIITVILIYYLIVTFLEKFLSTKFYKVFNDVDWIEKVLLFSFLITYQLKFFGINSFVLNLSFASIFFAILVVITLTLAIFF